MNVNFTEALATLYRALPMVLFRAGTFVAGGFMVIIFFGISLFTFRFTGGASPVVVTVATALAALGFWVIERVLQRFFLYRHRAALLLLFSGRKPPVPGLAAAIAEARRFFPDYSGWVVLNRGLLHALSAFYRSSGKFPAFSAEPANGHFSRILDRMAARPLSQAIFTLAFSRGGTDFGRLAREGLALYFKYGMESRRLARQWLWISATGLTFLFLCLALPNWFFFRSAGAPVEIGFILAAAIAWLLYQAFLIPFVLSGISAKLLAETRGKPPDPDLLQTLSLMVPDTVVPDKRDDND